MMDEYLSVIRSSFVLTKDSSDSHLQLAICIVHMHRTVGRHSRLV